jgi:iron-sulfur cluster repair protein YtfE (RIC family)
VREMQQDAVTLVRNDHRKVEELFEALGVNAGSRRGLVDQLAQELTIHTQLEEEILYPAVREAMSDGDELVGEAKHEHEEVDQALERLQRLDADGEQAWECITKLEEMVKHHVEEEEERMLPAFAETVGQERLMELGERMMARKEGASAPRREHAAASSRTKVRASMDENQLINLTKAELYEKAKEADIDGRSSMTKDELIHALAGR